jgi:menaquinol-cytochrome c reductase iron-sulfur subunit
VNTEANQSDAGPNPRLPMTLPQIHGADPPKQERPPDAQARRRRRFLSWLCLGFGGAGLASVVWAVVGFMLAPLEEDEKSLWRKVGKVGDFAIGSTTVVKFANSSTVAWAGYAGQTAAWLRRDDESNFTCFSINCTHLGCPVRWEENAELFMCPCHGGVYYRDGTNAAGPPPQPLPRYKVRVRDGAVEVLASPVPITRGVA